jgi:hypothetical protein
MFSGPSPNMFSEPSPNMFPEPSTQSNAYQEGMTDFAIQAFRYFAVKALVGSAFALLVCIFGDAQYLPTLGLFLIGQPDMLLHLFAQVFNIATLDGATDGKEMAELLNFVFPMLGYLVTSARLFVSSRVLSFSYDVLTGSAPMSHNILFVATFILICVVDRPLYRLFIAYSKICEFNRRLSSYAQVRLLKISSILRSAGDYFTKILVPLKEAFTASLGSSIAKLFRYMLEAIHDILRKNRVVTQEPVYTYDKLNPNEIRLLEISRRKPYQGLRCKLISVQFDDAPPYECISYSWGKEPINSHSITVSRSQFAVTSVVYDLLLTRSSFWKPLSCGLTRFASIRMI